MNLHVKGFLIVMIVLIIAALSSCKITKQVKCNCPCKNISLPELLDTVDFLFRPMPLPYYDRGIDPIIIYDSTLIDTL